MQHQDASRTMAVERYLLGELSEREADEFEAHMFECVECADAVTSGAAFADNARAVFRETAPSGADAPVFKPGRAASPAPWWKRWNFPVLAPSFAALALLCVAGYQRILLRQAAEPQGLAAYALKAPSRGDRTVIHVPAAAGLLSLNFDVVTDSPAGYRCEIRDARGDLRVSAHVPQLKSGEVDLVVGRRQLPAGEYNLKVTTEGSSPADAGEFPFTIQVP